MCAPAGALMHGTKPPTKTNHVVRRQKDVLHVCGLSRNTLLENPTTVVVVGQLLRTELAEPEIRALELIGGRLPGIVNQDRKRARGPAFLVLEIKKRAEGPVNGSCITRILHFARGHRNGIERRVTVND